MFCYITKSVQRNSVKLQQLKTNLVVGVMVEIEVEGEEEDKATGAINFGPGAKVTIYNQWINLQKFCRQYPTSFFEVAS